MWRILLVVVIALQKSCVLCKYVEGHLKTHEVRFKRYPLYLYKTIASLFPQDWAFVARFCFLSGRGRYEYHIEYEKRLGTPQLLLYYDDESQWPSVYKTGKSCLQKVAVLSPIDNQIVTLSTKRPANYLSGCQQTTSKERVRPPPSNTKPGQPENTSQTASTASDEADSSYFEQFLNSSTQSPTSYTTTTGDPTTTTYFSTTWMDREEGSGNGAYEAISLDNDTDVFNVTDEGAFVLLARDNKDGLLNGNRLENDSFQADVEELFSESSTENNIRVRRSNGLWSRENTGTIIISCTNAGGFTSQRERWWYIAIANCGSDKGIDIKYRFRMTNGPQGDFWHEHFSADEMCGCCNVLLSRVVL